MFAAGCPKIPEVPQTEVRRNVSVKTVEPKAIEIPVKLPVTLKAREEILLRSAGGGLIVDLPYEEGAQVPASQLPKAGWIEIDNYLKDHTGATDDELLGRNLAYLEGMKAFAHIDDRAARINFRDAQSQCDAATRALNRVLSYKDSSEAVIDNARTARAAARANCDRLRKMIEDSYITNPAAGVLKTRSRRLGEYVNGGELLGTVAVLDPLVAEFYVTEGHREAVKAGQTVNIEIQSVSDINGQPVKVPAKIRLVDAVAHAQTHSFRVEADIANPEHKLPAGVFGTLHLVVYQRDNAITAPLSALKLKGDKVSVFVVESGKAKEITDVKVGHIADEWVELLGDKLKKGQKLVVTGAQMIADGDLVEIRTDPTEALAQPKAKDGRS